MKKGYFTAEAEYLNAVRCAFHYDGLSYRELNDVFNTSISGYYGTNLQDWVRCGNVEKFKDEDGNKRYRLTEYADLTDSLYKMSEKYELKKLREIVTELREDRNKYYNAYWRLDWRVKKLKNNMSDALEGCIREFQI